MELKTEDKLQIKEIIEVIKIPTTTQATELDSDDEEEPIKTSTKKTNTPIETSFIELLTPEETIESESKSELELPQETISRPQLQKAPRDINGNIDKSHIIEGRTCTNTANTRRNAYIADLERLDEYPGYQAAFIAGLEHNKRQSQLHRDSLPPPPRS